MDSATQQNLTQSKPQGVLIAALACVPLAISVYLLIQAHVLKGEPVGCGGNSGCQAVLQSSWSKVLEIPVTAGSTLLYLTVIAGGYLLASRKASDSSNSAWTMLFLLSGAIVTAAIWFIGLQAIVVKSFCIWCLSAHIAGLIVCGLIWGFGRSQWSRLWPSTLGGAAMVCVMALVQWAYPSSEPKPTRLADSNPPSGAGEVGSHLVLLNGHLEVDLQKVPTLGFEDAKNSVAILFDYSCPHCRETHSHLMTALDRYPQQLRLVMLPMPLNADCNPGEEETAPRFKDSCKLARIALAVWRIDHSRFGEFDEWLFEPESPRSAEEARAQATHLIGEERLKEALKDPWIDQQIEQDVRAYMQSDADRIPVIASPGMDTIVGKPESPEALFSILETDLKLSPP